MIYLNKQISLSRALNIISVLITYCISNISIRFSIRRPALTKYLLA